MKFRAAAACVALWAAPASAATLCGTTAAEPAAMRHVLRLRGGVEYFPGGGSNVETFYDRPRQILWWLPTRRHPAYPAALCVGRRANPEGGSAPMPPEALCRGNRHECVKLIRRMGRVDW